MKNKYVTFIKFAASIVDSNNLESSISTNFASIYNKNKLKLIFDEIVNFIKKDCKVDW